MWKIRIDFRIVHQSSNMLQVFHPAWFETVFVTVNLVVYNRSMAPKICTFLRCDRIYYSRFVSRSFFLITKRCRPFLKFNCLEPSITLPVYHQLLYLSLVVLLDPAAYRYMLYCKNKTNLFSTVEILRKMYLIWSEAFLLYLFFSRWVLIIPYRMQF